MSSHTRTVFFVATQVRLSKLGNKVDRSGLVQKATILTIDAGGSAVSDIAEFFGFCMPAEPGCRILPVFGKPCAASPACGTAAPPNPQTAML